jgi:NTP pyrophosphatase (non-canonical NTP hydrolase)
MLKSLLTITRARNLHFPKGNDPFQIMTRLLEEGGELAQQVNHFDGSGVKREKYGEPDRAKLAKEIQDVLLCACQVVVYYGVEQEVEDSLQKTFLRLRDQGYIAKEE